MKLSLAWFTLALATLRTQKKLIKDKSPTLWALTKCQCRQSAAAWD